MPRNLCAVCKHEGGDATPFCASDTASTICSNYEFHATKEEVAAYRAEIETLKDVIEMRRVEVQDLIAPIEEERDAYLEEAEREEAHADSIRAECDDLQRRFTEVEERANSLARVLSTIRDLPRWGYDGGGHYHPHKYTDGQWLDAEAVHAIIRDEQSAPPWTTDPAPEEGLYIISERSCRTGEFKMPTIWGMLKGEEMGWDTVRLRGRILMPNPPPSDFGGDHGEGEE